MRRSVLPAALLLGLTLLAYAGHTPTEFVYDDREGVQENPVVNGELPWTAAFTHDFWGRDAKQTVATYRPVTVLVSRVAYTLGGGQPFAFRVVSILLHLSVIAAAFVVLGSLRGLTPGPSHFAAQNERGAKTSTAGTATPLVSWNEMRGAGGEAEPPPKLVIFIAILAFAVCAATSEAVLCIVGSADLLCALFALLGLWAHRRSGVGSALAAGATFLLALGSKESGAMAPVVWLAFDLLLPPQTRLKDRLPRFALYGALMVPYLFARKHALGAFLLPWMNGSLRNPLVTVDFFHRQLGAANIFLTKYLFGLVLPWRRMFDCAANACGPASVSDPIAWLGLLLWLSLLVAPLLLRKRAPFAAAGLAWFILFFLPGSNFLVTGPTIYGERLLYLPSIGLFFALMMAAIELVPLRAVWVMAGLFVVSNVSVDRQRLQDWSSNRALAQSGLRYAADSAIVQVNLAVESRPLKDYAAVEEHARKAIAIDPREMPPHRELAAALFATGRLDEARKEFEAAYAIKQDDVLVFDYANFLGKTQEYERGVAVIDSFMATHTNQPRLLELREKLMRAKARATAQRWIETLQKKP